MWDSAETGNTHELNVFINELNMFRFLLTKPLYKRKLKVEHVQI